MCLLHLLVLCLLLLGLLLLELHLLLLSLLHHLLHLLKLHLLLLLKHMLLLLQLLWCLLLLLPLLLLLRCWQCQLGLLYQWLLRLLLGLQLLLLLLLHQLRLLLDGLPVPARTICALTWLRSSWLHRSNRVTASVASHGLRLHPGGHLAPLRWHLHLLASILRSGSRGILLRWLWSRRPHAGIVGLSLALQHLHLSNNGSYRHHLLSLVADKDSHPALSQHA